MVLKRLISLVAVSALTLTSFPAIDVSAESKAFSKISFEDGENFSFVKVEDGATMETTTFGAKDGERALNVGVSYGANQESSALVIDDEGTWDFGESSTLFVDFYNTTNAQTQLRIDVIDVNGNTRTNYYNTASWVQRRCGMSNFGPMASDFTKADGWWGAEGGIDYHNVDKIRIYAWGGGADKYVIDNIRVASPATSSFDKISFEDGEVPEFAYGNNADVSVVSGLGNTHGDSAMKVDFGVGGFPSVRFLPEQNFDWGAGACLIFDATNPTDKVINLHVKAVDGGGNETVGKVVVPANTTKSAFMSFNTRAMYLGMRFFPQTNGRDRTSYAWGSKGLDISDISEFSFFVYTPTEESSIIIDNIDIEADPAASADYLTGIIDSYGQYSERDWETKIHNDAELKSSYQEELNWMAQNPQDTSERSKYGGWSAGPKLEATGHFRTEFYDGKWTLVDPEGYIYFSTGLDILRFDDMKTWISGRENMFQEVPTGGSHYASINSAASPPLGLMSGFTYNHYTANLETKYGSSYANSWQDMTIARMKNWGFTTLGNWSEPSLYWGSSIKDEMPFVADVWIRGNFPIIDDGLIVGLPVPDAFDPSFESSAQGAIQSLLGASLNDNPWCVGVYINNEISWGNPFGDPYSVVSAALKNDAGSSAAKKAFVTALQDKYGSISALNSAWNTDFASFSALNSSYNMPALGQRTEGQTEDLSMMLYMLAEKYYKTVNDAFDKLYPNELNFGSRLAEWGCPAEVEAAAAKHVDVLSYNCYKEGVSSEEWMHAEDLNVPTIIGEFHFGAEDERMFSPGLVAAATQEERGDMYQAYVTDLLNTTTFVGGHWFQYVDQPTTGRSWDGENYNAGFVDVCDVPYYPLVMSAKEIHDQMYDIKYGEVAPAEIEIDLPKTAEINAEVSETINLTANVTSQTITNKSVKWSSSNEKIATVDQEGKVTALANGTVKITATSVAKPKIKAVCTITIKNFEEEVVVVKPVVKLDKSTASIDLAQSSVLSLVATVTPTTVANKAVTWTSSDNAIATVDQNGKVTAKSKGNVTITATSKQEGSVFANCVITVTKTEVVAPTPVITLNKTTAEIDLNEVNSLQLTADVTPNNVANKSVTWTSSNQNIATVDASGFVSIKDAGTVTITAISNQDTAVKAVCTVTITKETVVTPDKEIDDADYSKISFEDGINKPYLKAVDGANLQVVTIGVNDGTKALQVTGGKLRINPSEMINLGNKPIFSAYLTNTSNQNIQVRIDFVDKDASKNPIDQVVRTYYYNVPANNSVTVSPSDFGASAGSWVSDNGSWGDYEGVDVANIDFIDIYKYNDASVQNGNVFIVDNITMSAVVEEEKPVVTPDPVVPVVTLDKTNVSVDIANTTSMKFTATVTPNEVTNKAVTWKTSNQTIATVDQNGNVTFLKPGTITVEATSVQDTTVKAVCTVTITKTEPVIEELTSISFEDGEKLGFILPFGGATTQTVAQGVKDGVKALQINAGNINATNAGVRIDPENLLDLGKNPEFKAYLTNPNNQEIQFRIDFVDEQASKNPVDQVVRTYYYTLAANQSKEIVIDNFGAVSANATTADGWWGDLSGVDTSKLDYINIYLWKERPNNTSSLLIIDDIKLSAEEISEPEVPVEVTPIVTLDKKTYKIDLKDASTFTLKATVTPDEVKDKSVTYKSSNTTIATVDQNGKVTALKEGTITIVAVSNQDANVKDVCTVTVVKTEDKPVIVKPVVTLNKETATINMDNSSSLTLTANVTPNEVENKAVTYKSSNNAIATVDQNGKVTAKSKGIVTITAVSVQDPSVSDSCVITITKTDEIIEEEINFNIISFEDDENLSIVSALNGATTTVVSDGASDGVKAMKVDVKSLDGKDSGIIINPDENINLGKDAEFKATLTNPNNQAIQMRIDFVDKQASENAVDQVVRTYYYNLNANDSREVVINNFDSTAFDASGADGFWGDDNGVDTQNIDFVSIYLWEGKPGLSATTFIVDGIKMYEVIKPIVAVNKADATIDMATSKFLQLSADVTPSGVADKSVKWTSSDNTIATVDQNGKVTALKAGEVIITATSIQDETVSDICEVVIYKAVSDIEITLDKENVEIDIEKEESFQLNATVTSNKIADKSLVWTSNKPYVAEVDENGKVTVLAIGEATITATSSYDESKSASCDVKVIAIKTPIEIEVSETELVFDNQEENVAKLTAKITPNNVRDLTVSYKSSNSNVASVKADGTVVANANGTAVISVISNYDTTKSVKVNVTVENFEEPEVEVINYMDRISFELGETSATMNNTNTDVAIIANNGNTEGTKALRANFKTANSILEFTPVFGEPWVIGKDPCLTLSATNTSAQEKELYIIASLVDEDGNTAEQVNKITLTPNKLTKMTTAYDIQQGYLAIRINYMDSTAAFNATGLGVVATTYVSGPRSIGGYALEKITFKATAGAEIIIDSINTMNDASKVALNNYYYLDEYGQSQYAEYPEKITSDSDLHEAEIAEQKQLDEWITEIEADDSRDQFGGWRNEALKQESTGKFYVKKVDGKWMMVDPEGYPYLATGLDIIRYGDQNTWVAGREAMFENLPDRNGEFSEHFAIMGGTVAAPDGSSETGLGINYYTINLEKKYGEDWYDEWHDNAIKRTKAWGFTSFGCWVDPELAHGKGNETKTPYAAHMWINSANHAKIGVDGPGWGVISDPFDPNFEREAYQMALDLREQGVDKDPWCIGVYVDNEIHWGLGYGSYLVASALYYGGESLDTSPAYAKRALVDWLINKYPTIEELNAAWATTYESYDAFRGGFWNQQVKDRTGNATLNADVQEMAEFIFDKYYGTIHDAVENALPNTLYIGSRFADWGCPTGAAAVAAKYCDVVSYNSYKSTPIQSWMELDTFDKPIIIGEFHFNTRERGALIQGLVPVHEGERSKNYQNYMNDMDKNDKLIGIHWFQYYDEPILGRAWDTENSDTGFVDVTDQPYDDLVDAARLINSTMYEDRFAGAPVVINSKPAVDPVFPDKTSPEPAPLPELPELEVDVFAGLDFDGNDKHTYLLSNKIDSRADIVTGTGVTTGDNAVKFTVFDLDKTGAAYSYFNLATKGVFGFNMANGISYDVTNPTTQTVQLRVNISSGGNIGTYYYLLEAGETRHIELTECGPAEMDVSNPRQGFWGLENGVKFDNITSVGFYIWEDSPELASMTNASLIFDNFKAIQ